MFDIGFTELLVIAVVALVVLGPERLPKAARFTGLWVRRARAQWHSVRDELERELAAEEIKRNMEQAKSAVRDAEQTLHEGTQKAQREFDELRNAVSAPETRADTPAIMPASGNDAPAADPAENKDGPRSD